MQLPKLLKTHILKLPTMEKPIEFRPFTVMEEKALLSVDDETSTDVRNLRVKEVVDTCTGGTLNFKKLSPTEVHFIFLNIRAKSVGEKATLFLACDKCYDMFKIHKEEFETKGAEIRKNPKYVTDARLREEYYKLQETMQKASKNVYNEVLVDIEKLKLDVDPNHTNRIQLDDQVYVDMSFGLNSLTLDEGDDGHDTLVKTIASCIDTIYDADQVYDNIPVDVKLDWLRERVSSSIIVEKFAKFFETAPTMKYDVEHKCNNCGNEMNKTLTELADFF